MRGSFQRLARDRRFQLVGWIYFSGFSVWSVWSSLRGSASYWTTTAWVATDNIAYFGWGALAGLFLFMIPLGALATLSTKNGPLGQPDPSWRLRTRPTIMFLGGLTVGAVVWGLGMLVALVLSGTMVPWPVIWGIGFGTAIFGWIPLICAGFVGYFHVRRSTLPARI